MKKKSLLQFVSIVLCLIFISSTSAFAETGVHLHSDACQHMYVDDIEEYLTQLNAGLIAPLNTTITTFDSDNIDYADPTINPFWLWTDCSNILGHSWGGWGSWSETGSRVHFPDANRCSARMERWRFCGRTNCSSSQIEADYVWVTCYH